MNTEQLYKQVIINRELIMRRNADAFENLDTLRQSYAHLVDDAVALHIELNVSLMALNYHSDYNGAIDNSLAAMEKYGSCTDKQAIALHLKMIGRCYAHTGEYDLADRYLHEALTALEGEDESYMIRRGDVLHDMALAEEFKDPNSEKIAEFLTQAIALLAGEKFATRRAHCMLGMGNYYLNVGEIPKALQIFKDALNIYEEKSVLVYIASCYSNMGGCYMKMGDYNEAERVFEKSLDLRLKLGSPDQIAISYYNMALLCKEKKDYAKAEMLLEKTLGIVDTLADKAFIVGVNDLLDKLNKLKKAPSAD